MKFEELKERYAEQEVTEEQFEEIAENEFVVEVENNGLSAQYPNLIWYSVYSENQEFEIYA